VLLQQAREYHRKSRHNTNLAGRFREQRDECIRRLHGSGEYSYSDLAKGVGCSPELVAKIVQGR